MPPLDALLADLDIRPQTGEANGIDVRTVTDDSRRCAPGTLFVAVEGTQADGHAFLAQAAEKGAAAALVARETPPPNGMPLIHVGDTRRALARIAQRLAGDPSHAMTVVGVTGTNGKTTVAYLMEAIFEAAGMTSGVMGTINVRWAGHVERESSQTTPSPTDLADYLRRMREAGVKGVAMEVSSHAIEQRRADGIRFAAAALTNLTQDHLDYHRTMAAYAAAKERLFTDLLAENPESVAVLNVDDATGRAFVKSTRARRVLTTSADPARGNAHVRARRVEQDANGTTLELAAMGRKLTLRTPMIGTFNVANCLTATGLALAVGIGDDAIAAGLATMKGAPGRFEPLRCGQPFTVLVDYAHTPDSLEKLLVNARGITLGRLIVVFGCGGDRDNTKRRPMGRFAAALGDEIIVTNDNPRTEDPERIYGMIEQGVREGLRGNKPWHKQLDRRKAIEQAIALAREGDTVVIAGKGHEDYQILGKEKIHFDDREVAREILR
jgi:UDP-N-acetylmuramyl-tripeptide synthetase